MAKKLLTVITVIAMITVINKNKNVENDILTEKIIGLCYEIHKTIGPGYNEKIYKNALKIMLQNSGMKFECERAFCIKFKNKIVGSFRADLIVEGKVIVETKAVHGFLPKAFEAQVIAYLKGINLEVGLLINFGNTSCQVRRLLNSQICKSL